jgi:glycolate oxidase
MEKERIRGALQKIVGGQNVLWNDVDLAVYEYDAGLGRGKPELVVFAHDADQVAQIVKLLYQEGISYVARGSGTNLSGGTVPAKGGVVIELSRMDRILEIDLENERAVV